jgi:imidazolonepropionase-like amidohydrolase
MFKISYNDLFMDCIRNAHKEGVKIVVGTDYCDWDVNLNVGEFKCLLDIGMTPMQAIKGLNA